MFRKRTLSKSLQKQDQLFSTYNKPSSRGRCLLGVIHSGQSEDPWVVNLCLNKQSVKFKIDTGADVTVIPASVYKEPEHGSLKPTNSCLNGADQQPLKVMGSFTGSLSHNNREKAKEIFVIQGLLMPLVGRPAISALKLVARVTLIQARLKYIMLLKLPIILSGLNYSQIIPNLLL